MIRWFKLMKIHKLPLFWWNYFLTKPFPEDLDSVGDLIEYGKKNKIIGFNRQCIRAYILWRISLYFRCTSFVETGTNYGNTTGFVQRAFQIRAFSCEINFLKYFISKMFLVWANGVTLFHSSSPDFLEKINCHDSLGDNPMFYLDAHWGEYMPLPDELTVIAKQYERAIVVIDDFFVPSEPRFGYDECPGLRIDTGVVIDALKLYCENFQIYLPNYDPSFELVNTATGMAIVFMGEQKEVPAEMFPFNLLARV